MDDDGGIELSLPLVCFIYSPIIDYRYSQALRPMICLCFCLGNDLRSFQLSLLAIQDELYHLQQFEQILDFSNPSLMMYVFKHLSLAVSQYNPYFSFFYLIY